MAAKKLVVYVWSVPTNAMQGYPLDTRKVHLKNALDVAYKDLYLRSDGIWPRGLFIAPEFLFAKPGTHIYGGGQRQLEEGEKDNLLREMMEQSKTMPGMLTIAGTVAWRKPWERQEPKQQSRYAKAAFAVLGHAARRGIHADTPLSGPHSGQPAKTTRQKFQAIVGASQTGNNDGGYARNTAYVLLDGEVLFKYNKQDDFHEVLDTTGTTVQVPGMKAGYFAVGTLEEPSRTIRFGLEICLDHTSGALKHTIGHGMVDIHLITSDWVNAEPGNVVVVDGGYVVHASSNQRASKVYLYREGALIPQRGMAFSSSLAAYELELESLPVEPEPMSI